MGGLDEPIQGASGQPGEAAWTPGHPMTDEGRHLAGLPVTGAPAAETGGAPEDVGLARNREMIADLTALNAQFGDRVTQTVAAGGQQGEAVLLRNYFSERTSSSDFRVFGVHPTEGPFSVGGDAAIALAMCMAPEGEKKFYHPKTMTNAELKNSLSWFLQAGHTNLGVVENEADQQKWSQALGESVNGAQKIMENERRIREKEEQRVKAQEGVHNAIRDVIKGAAATKTSEPGASSSGLPQAPLINPAG